MSAALAANSRFPASMPMRANIRIHGGDHGQGSRNSALSSSGVRIARLAAKSPVLALTQPCIRRRR